MSTLVPLNHGMLAIVDDEDYDLVSPYEWAAQFVRRSNLVYAITSVSVGNGRQETLRMHRLILGVRKGLVVDHRDANGLNNRKYNVRVCTQRENARNLRKRLNTSSQFKGVVWEKVKWRAVIRVNRKPIHLGMFHDEVEGARAYDEAAKKYFGEFAHLNFKEAA